MKRLTSYVILLISILSSSLFSYKYSFEAKEDGFIINLVNLDYSIQKRSVSNDSSSIKIINNKFAFPSTNSNFYFDELNFPIALPDFDVHLSYNIISSDTIENVLMFERKPYLIKDKNNKVELINKGIKRGIPVATLLFQPFEYDKENKRLIVSKSFRININFSKPVPLISNFNSKELLHFENYLNKEHIPAFIINTNNNKKSIDETLKKTNWYSPDKNYLRVTTKRDDICILEAKSIINADPDFRNKNIDYLHLLWEGEEYPIYINDNGNKILDDKDSIYFLGKRASGDTTWLDFYTDEANFFLFLDSTTLGLRLTEFPNITNPVNEIKSIRVNKHIEEEHIYMYGYFPELYENNDGEMWAWKIISPWDSQYFDYALSLFPTQESGDSLNISVRFKSNRFNSKQNPNHKLRYIFNSDTLFTKEYPAKAGDFLSYNFPSNQLLAGSNLLTIQSLGYYVKNELVIPDEVGIDYITVQGKSAPVANNSKTDFFIDNLTQNSSIKISGYNNKNIIIIDPDNQYIKINNQNVQGTSISAGSNNSLKPFLSLYINDTSIIKSGTNGALVGLCLSPDYDKVEFKFFDKIDGSLISYLNNIPTSSIIAIALSSNEDIPSNVKNILIQIGSQQINSFQAGNSFVMIVRKNFPNNIYEKLADNSSASIYQFIEHPNGKSYRTELNLKAQNSYHLISTDLSTAEICKVEKCEFSDLANIENQADVLVVYHKAFKEAAEKYASFRKQTHQNYNFYLIDIENIYKEFNYGRKSPHALKNFLRYSANIWQKPSPSFIILFGDACWDTRKVMPTTQNTDFISSYGVPISDTWFCLLDDKDYIADIELGRIPAKTQEQAMNYVDKLIEYEQSELAPWEKSFLYLTGGYNQNENNQFYNAAELYGSTVYDSRMCVDTFIIRKRNYSSVSSFEKDEIIARINQGIAWVTYLGHGSPQFFDMDGWQVEYLDNKNKYSIFNSLSCNTGAFAEPQGTCRNEDYLLAKDKGFISTSASTGVSFVDIDIEFHLRVSRQLARVQNRMPTIIELYNNAKAEMLRNEPEILTAMTYSMLGDPLVALRITPQPDLYFLQNDITIKNQNGDLIITEDDSIAIISGNVFNGGYSKPGIIKLLLIREYQSRIDSVYLEYSKICPNAYFKFVIPVHNMAGIHKITIIADPDKTNSDTDYSNNKYERYFEVFVKSLLPLEPLSFWDKELKNPIFRVINPEADPFGFNYEFEIAKAEDINQIIKHSKADEITITEAYIEWNPSIELINQDNYIFIAKAINLKDSTKSPMLMIPFTASSDYSPENTIWETKGKEFLSSMEGNGLEVKDTGKNSYLTLKNKFYPYKIISANGNQTFERFGEIKYRDTTHIVSENVGDVPVGFNFVIISGKEGYFKEKRNFYTWGKYEWWEDSTGINMVKFLRDSVDSNDYILIATCDQSFRLFVYHKELQTSGSLDTLVAVLKEYGSQYADSLRWGCSFAMVGKRGAKPGTFPEMYDTSGGRIIIQDSLLFYRKNATLTTPWFGPAKKWEKIKLIGDFPHNGITYKLTLYSKDRFHSNEKLLFEIDTSLNISLDSISTSDNAYLKYKFDIFRIDDTLEPKIYSLRSEFIPSAEFAMLKSLTYPLKDTILRGEVADLRFGVQNISARASSDEIIFKIRAYYKSSDIFNKEIPIEPLAPSSKKTINYSALTDNFAPNTIISSQINTENKKNELYYFNNNNSYTFHIYEDTLKPEILLLLNGKMVQNGDYSPLVPKVEIQLKDNSPRPVDSSKIIVRINGYIQPQPEVKDYIFTSYGRDVPLKAKLTFTPDTLDYRENVFIIKGTDASGNESEIIVYVFVSPKGIIDNVINYPNPFSDKTKFKLNFVSPIENAIANIYIFNEIGQKVRTIDEDLHIGNNEFEWDAKDDFGNSLPTGMYFYIILVKNNVFVEPLRGSCLFIR